MSDVDDNPSRSESVGPHHASFLPAVARKGEDRSVESLEFTLLSSHSNDSAQKTEEDDDLLDEFEQYH